MSPIPDRESESLSPSDGSLIRYIRNGDQEAAHLLYRRYADRIRRLIRTRWSTHFASRFDPDDVVQSVFRLVYLRISTQKYDVPAHGDLWRLLMVLALNKMRDQIRFHKAARRSVYQTANGSDPDHTAGWMDEAAETQLRLTVDEYLLNLPEADRQVVAWRMLGHPIDEIAAQSGRAVRTVERVLRQSRDQLAELLSTS
jgi:RNA polymerase sigma-70 factor (ECF subfamily)